MKLWQKNQAPHEKIDHFTVGKDREYDLYLAQEKHQSAPKALDVAKIRITQLICPT